MSKTCDVCGRVAEYKNKKTGERYCAWHNDRDDKAKPMDKAEVIGNELALRQEREDEYRRLING